MGECEGRGGGVPIESSAELITDLHETFAFIRQTSDLQREKGGEIKRGG